jgi:hypothetical protein
MTTFWLGVGAGCLVAVLVGFAAVVLVAQSRPPPAPPDFETTVVELPRPKADVTPTPDAKPQARERRSVRANPRR